MDFDTSWDISEYKVPYEPKEHWKLKEEFMLKYKEMFPKDKLVCLTQMYANVMLLGCIYPGPVMRKISALSEGLGSKYKERRKNLLQRYFVKASDAAQMKVQRKTWNYDDDPEFKKNEDHTSKKMKTDENSEKAISFVKSGQENKEEEDIDDDIEDSRPCFSQNNQINPETNAVQAQQSSYKKPQSNMAELNNRLQQPKAEQKQLITPITFEKANPDKCLSIPAPNKKSFTPITFQKPSSDNNEAINQSQNQSINPITFQTPGVRLQDTPEYKRALSELERHIENNVEDLRTFILYPVSGFVPSCIINQGCEFLKRKKELIEKKESDGIRVELYINRTLLGTGNGVSKKVAQDLAYKNALKSLAKTCWTLKKQQIKSYAHMSVEEVCNGNVPEEIAANRKELAEKQANDQPNNKKKLDSDLVNRLNGSDNEQSKNFVDNKLNNLNNNGLSQTNKLIMTQSANLTAENRQNNTANQSETAKSGWRESKAPERTLDDKIEDNNIGNKMLKMMGWGGGGLGKEGKGIVEPIRPSNFAGKSGIGYGPDSKNGLILGSNGRNQISAPRGEPPNKKKKGMPQQGGSHDDFLKCVNNILNDFENNYEIEDLAFSPEFTQEHRTIIQNLAKRRNIKSKLYGKRERYVVISRKLTSRQILSRIIQDGGKNDKYELFPPGHPGLYDEIFK